jgi:hypothetical protein
MIGNDANQRVNESASQPNPTLAAKASRSSTPRTKTCPWGPGVRPGRSSLLPGYYLTRMVQMLPVVSAYSYTIWFPRGDQVG